MVGLHQTLLQLLLLVTVRGQRAEPEEDGTRSHHIHLSAASPVGAIGRTRGGHTSVLGYERGFFVPVHEIRICRQDVDCVDSYRYRYRYHRISTFFGRRVDKL